MKSLWYYYNDLDINSHVATTGLGDREETSIPLLVNCAGKAFPPKTRTLNENTKGRLDYYLIYIVAGKLVIHENGSDFSVLPGGVFVFPPKTKYAFSTVDGEETCFLWVHFTGSDALNFLNFCGIAPFPKTHSTSSENNISQRFQRLFDGFSKKDRFRERDLSSLLERLLIEIGRAIETKSQSGTSLSRSLRHINEFYNSRIKITDLAKMEGMSETTFNLHFKRILGVSPSKYIIKLRMNSAIELLETSNMSVTEIASACGYEDINFFSRVFKDYVGISPTAYRKKSRD